MPIVLSALERGDLLEEWDYITAMGDFIDSPEEVSRLLGILLNRAGSTGDRTSLPDVLDQVSRKARVRVFADGTVEPLSAG
jgi:hypothetical protein